MPTLLELQRSISTAVLSRESDEAVHFIVGEGLFPDERLNIYLRIPVMADRHSI